MTQSEHGMTALLMQADWALSVDAYAQGRLAAESRTKHSRGASSCTQPEHGARKLLTPSLQSALTASGSGMLTYKPTGYLIDGADFTQFFAEAHSNHNVTGDNYQS